MLICPLRPSISAVRDPSTLAIALLVLTAPTVFAQQTQPAPSPQVPPQQQTAPADPAPDKPGLLGEIGKLLKSPVDMLPSMPSMPTLPSLSGPAPDPKPAAADKPNEPVTPTPPAATSPSPQPSTAFSGLLPGFVSGRESCPLSPNGAPDCQVSAQKLCQDKGYKEGKSLNTDSAFTCSAKRAPGRKPCGTEHFVTRAFCQ